MQHTHIVYMLRVYMFAGTTYPCCVLLEVLAANHFLRLVQGSTAVQTMHDTLFSLNKQYGMQAMILAYCILHGSCHGTGVLLQSAPMMTLAAGISCCSARAGPRSQPSQQDCV